MVVRKSPPWATTPRSAGVRPMFRCCASKDGRRTVGKGATYAGNVHVLTVTIPLLERAFAKLPQPRGAVRLRADGAFFDHKIIEFIEGKSAFYLIVARLTRPLKNRLPGLRYRRVSAGVWRAEFQYCPQGWPGPRRFVVIRGPVPEEPSAQLHLSWPAGAQAVVFSPRRKE